MAKVNLNVSIPLPPAGAIQPIYGNWVTIARSGSQVELDFYYISVQDVARQGHGISSQLLVSTDAQPDGAMVVTAGFVNRIVLPMEGFMLLKSAVDTVSEAIAKERSERQATGAK